MNACAVKLQGLFQALFNVALIAVGGHVDEVDDDQSADVAQPQLPGDFIRCFQVGLGGGFFDVGAFGGSGRVDVDGYQRFGVVDDDGAAGGQLDFAAEGGFDLAFDLIAAEQRDLVLVALELVQVLRHDLPHEVLRFLV